MRLSLALLDRTRRRPKSFSFRSQLADVVITGWALEARAACAVRAAPRCLFGNHTETTPARELATCTAAATGMVERNPHAVGSWIIFVGKDIRPIR